MPALASVPFREIERDRSESPAELVRQVAIEAANRCDHGTKSRNGIHREIEDHEPSCVFSCLHAAPSERTMTAAIAAHPQKNRVRLAWFFRHRAGKQENTQLGSSRRTVTPNRRRLRASPSPKSESEVRARSPSPKSESEVRVRSPSPKSEVRSPKSEPEVRSPKSESESEVRSPKSESESESEVRSPSPKSEPEVRPPSPKSDLRARPPSPKPPPRSDSTEGTTTPQRAEPTLPSAPPLQPPACGQRCGPTKSQGARTPRSSHGHGSHPLPD